MSRHNRRNRILCLLASVGLIGLIGSCSVGDQLEQQLEGEPCTVEKDCWHTQECTQTIDEANLGLPGLCQPEGTFCRVGQQLGCDCNPADPSINCLSPVLPVSLQGVYPKMVCNPMILVCVAAPPDGV